MKRIIMVSILLIFIAALAPLVPQQSQSESPARPALTIERVGGFAGVDDQVSISADGEVVDKAGKILRVGPASLEGFIRSIEKVGIPSADKATVPHGFCSDCFTYRISMFHRDIHKSFVVEEPIVFSSDKKSEDAKIIRDFLSLVFSQSRHK